MNIILFGGEPFFPRSDERYRHLRKVLKKGAGDEFRAGIENGSEGIARITRADDGGIAFDFVPDAPMRPLFPVSLLVGFPRPIQLKRLLRDAASLGARSIALCGTELGEKSYLASGLSDPKAARESLVEGCVQAGGTAIPDLTVHASAADALAALGATASGGAGPGATGAASAATPAWGARVLLDVEPAGAPSLLSLELPPVGPDRPLLLAIGSERGWTVAERALFREAGFAVASLGSRILRTETAVTAALALALAKTGYMEG